VPSSTKPPDDRHPLDPLERQALVARMRRIQGQARAVERMIVEEDTCERVLHQISAMRGALSRVGAELVACQLAQEIGGMPEEAARKRLSYWMARIGL
jgi:DNA-binding FrmR family transcriptional regulator